MPKTKKVKSGKKSDKVIKTRSQKEKQPVEATDKTIKKTKKKPFSPKSYSGFILKLAKQEGISLKGDLLLELDAATHYMVGRLIEVAKLAVDSRKSMQTVKPAAFEVAIKALLPASDFRTELLAAAKAGQKNESEPLEQEAAAEA